MTEGQVYSAESSCLLVSCGAHAEGGPLHTLSAKPATHHAAAAGRFSLGLGVGLFVNRVSLPSCYLKSTFRFCDIYTANILPGIPGVCPPCSFSLLCFYSTHPIRLLSNQTAQNGQLCSCVTPSWLFPLKPAHCGSQWRAGGSALGCLQDAIRLKIFCLCPRPRGAFRAGTRTGESEKTQLAFKNILSRYLPRLCLDFIPLHKQPAACTLQIPQFHRERGGGCGGWKGCLSQQPLAVSSTPGRRNNTVGKKWI